MKFIPVMINYPKLDIFKKRKTLKNGKKWKKIENQNMESKADLSCPNYL